MAEKPAPLSVDRLMSWSAEATERMEREERKRLRDLVGNVFDFDFDRPAKALALLDSADPRTRAGAIELLTQYGSNDLEHLPLWIKLFSTDSDTRVRSAALSAIIWNARKTRDSEASAMLAEIALDGSCEQELREKAYNGVFMVQDVPLEEMPIIRQLNRRFVFPRDADWAFMRGFLKKAP